MTYRLKILSSLLILSLLLISKPVKAYGDVIMFALPFLGAIAKQAATPKCGDGASRYDCRFELTHEEWLAQRENKIRNLTHIPAGACKMFKHYDEDKGMTTGQACKQSDGSWKIENGSPLGFYK